MKLLSGEEIRVIEFEKKYKDDIIKFLKSIAIDEFEYYDWRDYFDNMSFTPYEQSGSLFLIALNSRNKIVGTIGVLNTNKSNEVKLNSLYIDKAYRKCGIGKKLYELAQNYINEQKYKTIILHTYNKFADAIRFYEKNGFAIFDKDEEGFWYKKEL